MQSTERMQMPMNIQLVKLNFHPRSELITAIGRFSIRSRCETTRSVPRIADTVQMKKTLFDFNQ